LTETPWPEEFGIQLLKLPITRLLNFQFSSASSFPLCFKVFGFPIPAITRDDGDSGDFLGLAVKQ
jgi:hypothetical protein